MNRFHSVFCSLLLLAASSALALEEVAKSDAEKIAESLEKWEKIKAEHGGNYSYSERFSSFTGAGHVTTITVKENKIVERSFREFGAPPITKGLDEKSGNGTETWTEEGDGIGKHDQGVPARTLDELYIIAANVASAKLSDTEKRYLRFNEHGLLRSCFTINTMIADDAPRNGVALDTLEIIGLPDIHKAPSGKVFPAHWGAPPKTQTKHLCPRPLPGDYGRGSSILLRWINERLDGDLKKSGGE